jgi:hypothetical protein
MPRAVPQKSTRTRTRTHWNSGVVQRRETMGRKKGREGHSLTGGATTLKIAIGAVAALTAAVTAGRGLGRGHDGHAVGGW